MSFLGGIFGHLAKCGVKESDQEHTKTARKQYNVIRSIGFVQLHDLRSILPIGYFYCMAFMTIETVTSMIYSLHSRGREMISTIFNAFLNQNGKMKICVKCQGVLLAYGHKSLVLGEFDP